ncbi:MAG: hypothetical protein KAI83_12795 [Thiomargarita sp.]|nr:hypothetical protein [Thiomargarita sp.]
MSASTLGYPECNPPVATWRSVDKGETFHQDNACHHPTRKNNRIVEKVSPIFLLNVEG